MRKLLFILLILLLNPLAFGQFITTQQKPMLGLQVNWANPLSHDLVGCWLMNEGSGNKVFDLSGNGNNGVITGATWTSGEFGPSLLFDATSENVVVTWGKGIDQATGTIEMWFTPSWSYDDGLNHRLYDTGGANYFECNKHSANPTYFYFNGAWKGDVAYQWAAGTLYQIVVTWPSGLVYVNAQEILDCTDSVAGAATSLTLFNRSEVDTSSQGKKHLVRIWSRELSASEIALLYRESFCMFAQDSVALMEAGIPAAAPGGQVIYINMGMIPLLLIPALIMIKLRDKCQISP